eukprot:782636-Prymnesium_polylepis.1
MILQRALDRLRRARAQGAAPRRAAREDLRQDRQHLLLLRRQARRRAAGHGDAQQRFGAESNGLAQVALRVGRLGCPPPSTR